MKKMYLARVGGDVKWEHISLSAAMQCLSHKDGVYAVAPDPPPCIEHNPKDNIEPPK